MANEKRLIDAIELANFFGFMRKMWSGSEVMNVIHEAETVDAVEVKHGMWDDGECTACGFDIRDMIDGESEFRNWVWEGIPYCPNCGADMRGKKDA